MNSKLHSIEQCQARNHSNAWIFVHDGAQGLSPRAKTEINKSNKLILQAQELSFKALGRKRKS